MKYLLLTCCLLFVGYSVQSQFQVDENGLTIIVTDGTEIGKNSKVDRKNNIPTSYEQIGSKSGSPINAMVFNDPIRSLGMKNCIQAAAFLDRPEYGKIGFMLIFSLNDSIGGRQAIHTENGKVYKGVYRLIRQKTSISESVPEGMTTYEVVGTFLLLGIS